jgi:predicted hydrolase (HD superfamily)
MGVVLSLAKTFESDDDFIDAAGLLHDVKFSAHGGQVADFALLLIETDMQNAQDANAGRPSADAVLY